MRHAVHTPQGTPTWMWVFVVVVFLACCDLGSACNGVKTPAGYVCDCETRFGHDSLGGWHLSCYASDQPGVQAFIIEYAINDAVRVQCDSDAPFRRGMYQDFNISEVRRFSFSYCPMPNGSFAEVLEGMTVSTLRLVSCQVGDTLNKTLFEGLDSLKRLTITGSKELNQIPEDMFENMTSVMTLELNNNGLKELPERVFWPLTNVTSIQLGGNGLERLYSSQFLGLSNLVSLFLYKNRLKQLPEGVFGNLTSLRNLDLLQNELTNVTAEDFADLSQLENLKLGGNPFRHLPDALFINNRQLGELNLNALTELGSPPERLLAGLGRLENISFSDSGFGSVPEKFFAHAPNLKSIKMQNNRLTTLPANVFKENTKLLFLDFSYNDIIELPPSVFEKQYVLETLHFYKNNFEHLRAGPFDNLVSLRVLSFESNFLVSIEKDTFLRLQKLEDLMLGNNKLQSLEGTTPFGYNKRLKRVDLSRNDLVDFPDINWEVYLALEKVNLDHNNITRFRVPNLISLKTEVSLRHNKIETVEVSDLLFLSALQNGKDGTYSDGGAERFYYLENNPFRCDCQLYDFVRYVRGSMKKELAIFEGADHYVCRSPDRLEGERLSDVKLTELHCDVREGCPANCTCFFRRSDHTTHINCSERGLLEIPTVAPFNVSVLDLRGNRISSLASLVSPQWANLTEVYLDHNSVSFVDVDGLPPSVRKLSLTNNRIARLDPKLMNTLSGLSLFLSGNPWVCDCSTFGFKTWLRGHIFQVKDYSRIACKERVRYNSSVSLQYINEIPDSVFCPPDTSVQRRQLALVSGMCIVLAVLLVVVSALYYRHRQTIVAYFYIHFNNVFMCIFNEEDLDEDKVYDAFISYSSADRDVAMGLLNCLENSANEEQFKLCIHERDWLPGYNISWNIVNSVQNSRRTILVVSKDFLESLWFQVEFHTAYYQMLEDRVDRLIVITKGDLPSKDTLDKDLRFLLSTKTYLVWGERWFWEKLRYAMPHRKRAAPSDKLQLRNRPNTQMVKTVEEQIASLTNGPKAVQKEKVESAETVKTRNNNGDADDVTVEAPPRRPKRVTPRTTPEPS